MDTVIESSVWVDYFRSKTPPAVRQIAGSAVNLKQAVIIEPVAFELLRSAHRPQRPTIEAHFATMRMLLTPANLWRMATDLGKTCQDEGLVIPALDIVIAAICLHHKAEVTTFDKHFPEIQKVSALKVRFLTRPS